MPPLKFKIKIILNPTEFCTTIYSVCFINSFAQQIFTFVPGTALTDGNKAVNKSDKNLALTELIYYVRRETIFLKFENVLCPLVTSTDGKNNKGGIRGGVGELGLKLKCNLVKPHKKVAFK